MVFTTMGHANTPTILDDQTPPANEVCEGYVFTGVCLSTGGCLPPQADTPQVDNPHPPGQTLPQADILPADTPRQTPPR